MIKNETTMYTIFCPALDERETAASMHEANDIAFDMHTDSGEYVWCEDYLGHTVVEYGEAWLVMNKSKTIRFNSQGVYASDTRLASIAAECIAAERAAIAARRAAIAAGAQEATWQVNW